MRLTLFSRLLFVIGCICFAVALVAMVSGVVVGTSNGIRVRYDKVSHPVEFHAKVQNFMALGSVCLVVSCIAGIIKKTDRS